MNLIDDWRDWWRFTSTWTSGAAISVLVAWNMMPEAVRDAVPDLIEVSIGVALWLPVLIARITKQGRLERKRNAAANP